MAQAMAQRPYTGRFRDETPPEVQPPPPTPDLGEHRQTYAGFRHLFVWFAVHASLDLVGIYFLLAQGSWTGLLLFVGLGTATLIWAIGTTARAAREGAEEKDGEVILLPPPHNRRTGAHP